MMNFGCWLAHVTGTGIPILVLLVFDMNALYERELKGIQIWIKDYIHGIYWPWLYSYEHKR